MKLKLFLLLLICSKGFAQLQLEHSYVDKNVYPIQFPTWGLKYYWVDDANGALVLYNADHSIWKNIVLTIAPGSAGLSTLDISENIIDPDTELEILYTFDSTTETVIQKESGTVLFQQPNISLYLDKALPAKLVGSDTSGSGLVYDAVNLTLEATYPEQVRRVFLEQSGFKYQYFDSASGLLSLSNADHTPWKTINMAVYPGLYYYPSTILEQYNNGSPKVSVAFTCYDASISSDLKGVVVNEDGLVQAVIPNTQYFYYDNPGGTTTPKLYAYSTTSTGNSTTYGTTVLGIPGFATEHTFTDGAYRRENLELSGLKYIQVSYPNGPATCHIYNEDYTLWKSFPLATLPSGSVINFTDVSETTFNDDAQIEAFYGTYSLPMGVPQYNYVISNESGTLLQTFNDMRVGNLIYDGANLKIFGTMVTGLNTSDEAYHSEVYSFTPLSVSTDEISAISVFPNPVNDFITINAKENIVIAELFDLNGRSVRKNTGTDITHFDTGDIAPGCYLLTLTNTHHQSTVKKISKI